MYKLVNKISEVYYLNIMKKRKRIINNKHLDDLELLSSEQEFQDRVSKIRDHLNIPEEMYSKKVSEKNKNKLAEKWQDEMITIADNFFDDQYYLNLYKEFRNKFESGEIKKSEYENELDKLNQIDPFTYLTVEIKKIIGSFNLPLNYARCIRQYILFNNWTSIPAMAFDFKPEKDKYGGKSVSLLIYEKINDKDLVEIKKFVNEYLGKDLPNIKLIKNLKEKIIAEQYNNDRNYVDPETGKIKRPLMEETLEILKDDTGISTINKSNLYDFAKASKKLKQKRFKTLGKK
jgi:hypothetical protein